MANAKTRKARAVPAGKIGIENVIRPGRVRPVDAEMYTAMKRAYLKVLPAKPPGATIADVRSRLLAYLPETLYPGGAKAGWWAKAVQLDLEAKGLVARTRTTPLRLYKA